jgi:4-hydroxy-4-methyl-2-oxoglutarate aldolase
MNTRSSLMTIAVLCSLIPVIWLLHDTSADILATPPDDPVIEGLSKLAVASISDAVDEITGQRGFMMPDLRPILSDKKIIGRAVTVRLREAMEVLEDRSAVSHTVQVIDQADPGSIIVVVVENGAHIAGFGGLMANTSVARGLGGAVIDGGARDIQEMQDLGFQVYTRGITPASSVGRWLSVASNEPILCANVWVRNGDIIVGDYDGVVCVPAEIAQKVLETARKYEEKERQMVPLIHKYKSLQKALEAYGRI